GSTCAAGAAAARPPVRPRSSALALASIAAWNRGSVASPARYVISAAATSGSATSAWPEIAAAAAVPPRSTRGPRNMNAALQYRNRPAFFGGTSVSCSIRRLEAIDHLADPEHRLQELRLALHLDRGPVGRWHAQRLEDRARRVREDHDVIAEVDRLLDR